MNPMTRSIAAGLLLMSAACTMADEPASSTLQLEAGPRPAPAAPLDEAGSVFVVPRSIPDDGSKNVTEALQKWLDGLPRGATAAFDQTGTSEGWVAGHDEPNSTYRLNKALVIDKPLTLWGYGSELSFVGAGTDVTSGGIYLDGEAASGSRILGFEVSGGASLGATHRAWSGEDGERPHGVSLIGHVKDVEIADMSIHDTNGDGIYKDAWPEHRPNTASGGFWVHHNQIARTGRQGIVINVGVPTDRNGFGWKIEHNQLYDIGLYPIDAEDARSTKEALVGVYIEGNDFRRWNWEAEASFNNRCHAISLGYKAGPDGDQHVLGRIDDVTISGNAFGDGDSDGCMGFGGDGHPAVGDANGGTISLRLHDRSVRSTPKRGVSIVGNTWNVSRTQRTGPYVTIADCHELTVTDNDIQGSMDLTTFRCENVLEASNE